jgi:hypothetical protein
VVYDTVSIGAFVEKNKIYFVSRNDITRCHIEREKNFENNRRLSARIIRNQKRTMWTECSVDVQTGGTHNYRAVGND